MSTRKLSNAHREIIVELYGAANRTVDDLPYSDEFEGMFRVFCARTGRDVTRHEFWKALANARKASRLVRKER
ncbi:MAG: hypothetical protein GY842_22265 [bacterium]|nr:hypothetical protein [bacterium]